MRGFREPSLNCRAKALMREVCKRETPPTFSVYIYILNISQRKYREIRKVAFICKINSNRCFLGQCDQHWKRVSVKDARERRKFVLKIDYKDHPSKNIT